MAKNEGPKAWVVILILLGLFIIASFMAAMVALFSGDVSGPGNVVVIPIHGVIVSTGEESFFFDTYATADRIIEDIERAEEDPTVEAVIFEINSPGGSAVSSEEIAFAVENMEKPKVAWIREVGASGAYWIATSTDHIIASRMSITGSVGVISSYLDFSGFLEDYNVSYERLVSGKYKDTGTPFRPLKSEERKILQEKLDTIHGYFLDQVQERRNLSLQEMREIETGVFFLGIEAYDLHLVDEIGNRQSAIDYLESKLNTTVNTKEYKHSRGLFDTFGVSSEKLSYAFGKGFSSNLFKDEPFIMT